MFYIAIDRHPFYLIASNKSYHYIGRYLNPFDRDVSMDKLSRGVVPANYGIAFLAYCNQVKWKNNNI
jgi:hypothetical protein